MVYTDTYAPAVYILFVWYYRYVLWYVEWKINFLYMTFLLITLPGHFFSLATHILLFIMSMTSFGINVIWLARKEGAFPYPLKIFTEKDVAMDMLSYHHCAMQ